MIKKSEDGEMTGIVVMADYQADPVWAADRDGRPGPMISLDDLPASDALKADLRAWAGEYDALAETDYEWPSEDRRRRWEAVGRSLADRLARELGPTSTVSFRA